MDSNFADCMKGPTIPIPSSDVASFMLDNMRSHLDNTAYINEQYQQKFISYRELLAQIENLATVLHNKGIKKGDIVAMYAAPSHRFAVCTLAILRVGGIVATTGVNQTPEEVAEQWGSNCVKLVFCDGLVVPKGEKAAQELYEKHSTKIQFVVLDNAPTHKPENLLGYYLDLVNSVHNVKLPEVKIDVKDIAFLLYSSGSTGKPKPVALSHAAIVASVEAVYGIFEPSVTSYISFPMVHAAGLSCNLNCLKKGTTIINTPSFDLENALRMIQEYKVDTFYFPPSIAVLLVKRGSIPYDLSSLKFMYTGAAIFGAKLQIDLERKLRENNCNAEILQLYAMSEMIAGLQSPQKNRKHKPGSAGMVSPNLELKLIGRDGKHVPAHTNGEILLRGPYTMTEYKDNPEATREFIDEEGWAHTGDVAYYDEDGYFFIVDRMKDLIKYMGNQVSASELEELLLNHSGIKECTVIGIASELEGELPTAVVVLKPEVKVSEEELVEWVNTKVADHKKLRGGVIFIDQLPRNPQGKILRAVLRQKFKHHQSPQVQRKNISNEVHACLASGNKERAKKVILDLISEVISIDILGLKSASDSKINLRSSILDQGINSSGAVLLRSALSSSLSLSLPITLVFEHPAPESLAEHVLLLMREDPTQISPKILAQAKHDIQKIASEMDLSKLSSHPLPTRDNARAILLTGATGFVGCHMLAELLRVTRAEIHCVVRASDDRAAHERVMAKLKAQLCWTQDAETRVVAHAGNLSAPNLGTAQESYAFFQRVDAIYHVGAVVNWVLPYSQMRENVTSGAEMIKMIARNGRKIPFHVISTIGATFIDVTMRGGKMMEGMGGYLLSKWAGDQVALHARSQGLPVTIFRLPFVSPDSSTGAANLEDELVRTILSCNQIGSVPELPSDVAPFMAMAVNELVSHAISLSFTEDIFSRPLVQYIANEGPSWHGILVFLFWYAVTQGGN
eukprot:Phypoly_transcript_01272.p1 GENE.Phypoly_transcript_01272~~Phypoly_transcript_01272.p1  ORF type:complete len:964 (-),score=156.58 Phypoly_transcript_01272:440-3331(-)